MTMQIPHRIDACSLSVDCHKILLNLCDAVERLQFRLMPACVVREYITQAAPVTRVKDDGISPEKLCARAFDGSYFQIVHEGLAQRRWCVPLLRDILVYQFI